MGTCILLMRVWHVSLKWSSLLTPLVGPCVAILPVWRITSSIQYVVPCSAFDVNVVVLDGFHGVDLWCGSWLCVVQLRLQSRVSSSCMRGHTLGMVYRPILSYMWVTVETPVLRSPHDWG